MKSKNVREEYSRKRKKDIKMHVEYELSAVMGTFKDLARGKYNCNNAFVGSVHEKPK